MGFAVQGYFDPCWAVRNSLLDRVGIWP